LVRRAVRSQQSRDRQGATKISGYHALRRRGVTAIYLYALGADFVNVPRLLEAQTLCEAIVTARQNRLNGKAAELNRALAHRAEIIS
jgi:ribosomal protein L4